MKNKISYLAFIGISMFVISSSVRNIQSNAAPIGSTGAPGEFACNKSGCHISNEINAGKASLTISYQDPSKIYEPNKTYEIVVSLQQANIQRFGFQLLALNANNENMGTFIASDSIRTQIQEGIGAYEGRNYITYKYPGTLPYSAGLGQWTIQWKAPSSYQGPITFYAAAVAANNDATDAGDTVYTKQLIIHEKSADIQNKSSELSQLIIFPNPCSETVKIHYQTLFESETCIQILDLSGKKSYKQLKRNDSKGTHNIEIGIADLEKGIYLVRIETNNTINIKKILVTS